MNRPRAPRPTLIAVLAILVAACTPATEPASSSTAQAPSSGELAESEHAAESRAPVAATESVQLTVSQFDPVELSITIGTEVSFANVSGFEHTVTEGTDGLSVDDPFVDESVAADATLSVTFDEAGTYQLTCRIHPTMNLTVTVDG